MAIALYPGSFKPPHRGHFNVVKQLATKNATGKEYSLDNYQEVGDEVLSGDYRTLNEIDKVVVFIGGGVRDNVDQVLSKEIWDTYYFKHLPSNVEIIAGDGNPMKEAKEYAKKYPEEKFYAITGIRGEEDYTDLKRLSTFKNLDNVTGVALTSLQDKKISATSLRKAALDGNIDSVQDFFPKELTGDEILKILDKLKQVIIAEMKAKQLESPLSKKIATQVEGVFNAWFDKEESVKDPLKEGSGGTPIAPMSAIKSSDRNKLDTLYHRLRNMIGDDFYKIIFNQDHIRIQLKGSGLNETLESESFDFTPHIASILEYMIDEGMNILPIPEVKLVRDEHNAKELFGKTAHYNPVEKEIVLYIEGRHPKDVLRSFAHEMIHHKQNLENRLNNISTTNTNEDDNLLELEKEAYLEGNITFRNWEDGIKNSKENLNEDSSYDKYEWLADELAEKYVTEFRENFEDLGNTKHHIEEFINKSGLSFELDVTLMFNDKVKDIDGQAYAIVDIEEEDDDYKEDDRIEVEIHVNPKIEKAYSVMQETLLQFLVHEMEHLKHHTDSLNRVEDEEIPEVNKIRSLINMGAIPAYTYRLLPREVAAAVKEFMAKAKSSGREFADIVHEELDKEGYNQEEKEAIVKAYRKELKRKNFNVTLQEQEQDNLTFYLDMDGVLADFDRRFTELAGQSPDDYKNEKGENAFWDFIDEKHKKVFWVGIPLMKGAKNLVNAVKDYNYQILTSPSIKKQSEEGKQEWIEKYKDLLFNGNIPKVEFKSSGKKHTVKTNLTKNDILIDDRSKNIDPWIENGGTGILYKNINQVLRDINNEITSYKVSGKE